MEGIENRTRVVLKSRLSSEEDKREHVAPQADTNKSMITLGTTLLVIAAMPAVLGALTWPPGGLMFALPFVFLMPAVIVGVLGGVLRIIGRRRKRNAGARPSDAA